MSDSPLRIGLVGAGGIGKVHLARYPSIQDAVVVAICDADPAITAAAAGPIGASAFSDVEEMLANSSLDAIDICTPPVGHAPVALAAIARGLHVLCEKPLAHSVEAARQMVNAAEHRNVLLMAAFCHRFHPPIAFVRELIDRGEMGEIVMFRNRFAGPLENAEHRWFSKRAIAGGGALMDTSIHSIDLFRFLVGEVDRVQGAIRHTNPAVTEVEDTAMALLTTVDGRMGVVEACWSLPDGVQVVEVYGTKGTAIVHYWDGLNSRYRTESTEGWTNIGDGGTDRFAAEIQHFVDACRGKTPLPVTGHDGLRAVEVVFQAYESARAGA